MRLRTYTAPTMPEAMALVRRDMGDDAIIVSTAVDADDHLCWVSAAIEERDPLEDDADFAEEVPAMDPQARRQFLRQVLHAHGLPEHILEQLLRDTDLVDVDDPALALAAALDLGIAFKPIDIETQRRPLLLAGINDANFVELQRALGVRVSQRGDALTIFGDGEQTRDYVFVRDVVAANMAASDLDLEDGEGLDSRAFNVGTGTGTSVNQLADVLAKIAGSSQPRDHEAERPGELRHSTLDASLLRSRGWAPAFTLEEGLRETYEFIAEQRALKA